MPGEITINTTTGVYTEQVKSTLPLADQLNLAANAGSFGAEYTPAGALFTNTVAPGKAARLEVSAHPDQSPELQQLIKDALEEFYTGHPKGLELWGKMARGEIQDQPGIRGVANWIATFSGATYDAGDGRGSFTVGSNE